MIREPDFEAYCLEALRGLRRRFGSSGKISLPRRRNVAFEFVLPDVTAGPQLQSGEELLVHILASGPR